MIKVYKFGGASVGTADGVRNVAKIMEKCSGSQVLIVVSAMGKMTNALEKLCDAYMHNADTTGILDEIRQFHFEIIHSLFPDEQHPVYNDIANSFTEIEWILEDEPHPEYDFNYDQIVSMGELISSKIVAAFLKQSSLEVFWADARGLVLTDNTYREGKIDWFRTRKSIETLIPRLEKEYIVTQGFIGGTSENFTTTLGREGSDYTAAVFATCLGAESVTIWKDVAGVFNCDPNTFNKCHKYEELPYSEALEMTYYGATVIHPKTIKPLKNANIPLFVRPFLAPEEPGTRIHEDAKLNTEVPAVILKKDQILLTIRSKDYSFMNEEILSRIFKCMAEAHIKPNVLQLSALSISICSDDNASKIDSFKRDFPEDLKFKFNSGIQLLTIRHYTRAVLKELTEGKEILLEQISRNTAQYVLK